MSGYWGDETLDANLAAEVERHYSDERGCICGWPEDGCECGREEEADEAE